MFLRKIKLKNMSPAGVYLSKELSLQLLLYFKIAYIFKISKPAQNLKDNFKSYFMSLLKIVFQPVFFNLIIKFFYLFLTKKIKKIKWACDLTYLNGKHINDKIVNITNLQGKSNKTTRMLSSVFSLQLEWPLSKRQRY